MSEISLVDLLAAFARIPGAVGRHLANRAHRRMMRKAPAFTARDMPENTFGKLVGRVRPLAGRVLEAPLSKRLCVYYDISIDAMADNSMLRTLASVQDAMTFMLEDETGRAVIDPAHAMVSSGIDSISYSGMREAATQERELLVRTGLSGATVPFADHLRYREAILEVDELIAVYGGGVREQDADAVAQTYRDGAPTCLHLTGTAKFPLFISDDPQAL